MATWLILGLVAAQRISELILARRNQRWALEHGGILIQESHYWMFFVLHIGWFLATAMFSNGPQPWFTLGIVSYMLLQILRYWIISSLGKRWNTKIIVFRDAPLIQNGPFRWFRHPNYIVVALELALVPMMVGAWQVAVVATVLNAGLLLGLRIPAEERALRDYSAGR